LILIVTTIIVKILTNYININNATISSSINSIILKVYACTINYAKMVMMISVFASITNIIRANTVIRLRFIVIA